MGKSAQDNSEHLDDSENRYQARKRVLFGGVIADGKGENARDCTIRNVSAGGAQIGVLSPLQTGERVYLLDTTNHTAYSGNVVWCKSGRAGLSFVQDYALCETLPSELKFLWVLLVEAKVRQVHALTARGKSMEEALELVRLEGLQSDRAGGQSAVEMTVKLLLGQVRSLLNKGS